MTEEVNNDGLHVEEAGRPDGPPALFLHGFMASNLQWVPNKKRLGAELRMLLTEQPGHGRSPGPDDPEAYRATTVLDQLERIRVARDIDRWWLIGHSLGGAILIRYALRHPERVAGLVFTNSRAVFGIAGKQVDGRGETDLGAHPTREQVRDLPYHPRHAKRLPADLKARMVDAADTMPLAVFRHLEARGPWQSADDLHHLSVPTLLINGRFEKTFQPCVPRAKEAIAGLQVVNLDAGHSLNIDQPEAFDQAVLEFVRSHRSPNRA